MHLNINSDAFSVHRSLMIHDINTIANRKLKIEREREIKRCKNEQIQEMRSKEIKSVQLVINCTCHFNRV